MAAPAEMRAALLVNQCEGVKTPALQFINSRARLTPGELEAAAMAATGRSDKEIAEGLHLSVRTIEHRLQKVYEKMGISGRKELAKALQEKAFTTPT
jgi:DNA-binding CsgD family transcriptional regulator